ncbi:MAG: DNA topoisomerase, partial [Patescibacteria group bacterium]
LSANIDDGQKIPNFSINGSVILFPGWLALDKAARGEDVELPHLEEGDKLTMIDIQSEAKETEPPTRYTEAGLVKELEKREIGRPSTYASIIKTLLEREYITKQGKTLFPTDTGDAVSSFLEQNFGQYISDSFTAEMERKLDEIAEGKRDYVKSLKDFYGPFSKEVKSKEHIEKITNLGEADPSIKCPVCGAGMVIKLARNGKFLSCKNFPKCIGARKIDGSEMEAPKETGELCPKCGGKLIEREGRYGKFVACANYPKCKYVKKSEEEEARAKTGVKCPKCGTGEMTERRGRFGLFYSCSNYPDCKYIIKSKPTGNLCKLCGSLMMEGTKTIPERCSDKNCPNHNPHKLKK